MFQPKAEETESGFPCSFSSWLLGTRTERKDTLSCALSAVPGSKEENEEVAVYNAERQGMEPCILGYSPSISLALFATLTSSVLWWAKV